MTTRAEATAAPGEVTIGDKTYRMTPLGNRDYGELDNWIQARSLRTVRESIPPGTSVEEYNRIMSAAMVGIQSLTLSSTRGAAIISSVAGFARALWQGIHPHDPEVTIGEIEDKLYALDSIAEVEYDFERVNQSGAPKKKKPKKEKKGSRNRRKKRRR